MAAFSCLACTLGNANAHVGKAGILHDGTDVSKVRLMKAGTLIRLEKLSTPGAHVIGCFKSFIRVIFSWLNELQPLVRITIRLSTCIISWQCPCSAMLILRLPSKAKGLVTIPTVRMPRSWAVSATTRCSAGAGAAAHASGDEHHLGTFSVHWRSHPCFPPLHAGRPRVSTSAAALGQLCAKLNLLGSLGVDQLPAGRYSLLQIQRHSGQLQPCGSQHCRRRRQHRYLNVGYILHLFIENERHKVYPPKEYKIANATGPDFRQRTH